MTTNHHNTIQLSDDTRASLSLAGLLCINGIDMEGLPHMIHLSAEEAWGLLQWLHDHHRDRLYKLSQHPEQRGGVSLLLLRDTTQEDYQEFSDELARQHQHEENERLLHLPSLRDEEGDECPEEEQYP